MKATQNKIGIKVLIGILLMAIMVSVLLCAAFSVFAENDVQTDEVIEVHDLAPIEISAPSISTFTLDSDGKVALKDGNYVKWIDRIDLTGADYAVRLYQWLEANADVDGALADPTKGQYITDGTYGYLIETFEGKTSFTPQGSESANKTAAQNAVASWANVYSNQVDAYISAVYSAFDRDHAEIFWLSGTSRTKSSYSYFCDEYGNVSVTLDVYFVLKASDFDVRTPAYQSVSAIKNMADKRDAAIEAIASGASGTTVDKIKYLNEWLVENNCYNSSSDLNSIDKICHECVTALLGNVGTSGPVCDSYSKAFMLLCNKLGIECVVVDGYASSNGSGGAHMWNYVRMDDGKWYGVDVTWNDPTVFGITGALSGYENDDYLLVGNNTVVGGSTFADSHIMQNTVTVGGTSFVNGPVIEDDKYTESESGNKAMTVYFDQPYDWMGDMYVYYWSGTNSSMVSWPGKSMTEIGGGLWYFDLPDGVEYVIFNDGSQQTHDIPISADCKDKLYSDGQWVPCVKAVFTGASITAGADLTMNYYTFIYGHILESSQKYAVIFTMNDKSVTVTDYTMINGEYVFAFEGIAPQCMGDLIDASLVVLDANGQIVQTLYQQSGYSVKLNCVQLLTVFPEDERLTVLIGDMLNYGAAAQLYIGYKTDELVNADVNIATSVATPQKSDLLLTTASGVTVDKTKFASAGVWFDNVNKLYFKIKVADISKVTVTVNGVAVNTEDMEKLDDSTYIVYTDGIYATGFDRVYTVKLYENGTLLQTLEYSVRSYVLTMMKKTESDGVTPTAMANLAKTLYAYGKSAESYVNQ